MHCVSQMHRIMGCLIRLDAERWPRHADERRDALWLYLGQHTWCGHPRNALGAMKGWARDAICRFMRWMPIHRSAT